MKKLNVKEKIKENKGKIIVAGATTVGVVLLTVLTKSTMKKSVDSKSLGLYVKNCLTRNDLPKPEINGTVHDFWLDGGKTPMASVTLSSHEELSKAASILAKSIDIPENTEVWSLIQWKSK